VVVAPAALPMWWTLEHARGAPCRREGAPHPCTSSSLLTRLQDRYLRHRNMEAWADPFDGSDVMAKVSGRLVNLGPLLGQSCY
jgi:hypothetical protein